MGELETVIFEIDSIIRETNFVCVFLIMSYKLNICILMIRKSVK